MLENNLSYSPLKKLFYSDDDIVEVCGAVGGVWETGKTYLLTCNVNIPEDSILIIEEGVKVKAMPDEQIEIRCYGTIEAYGTASNPISFCSASEVRGTWEGIKIYGTFYNCKFWYCIIEHSVTAVSLFGSVSGCDYRSNYSEFRNCIVRNNAEDGFYCSGSGNSYLGCSIPKTGASSPTIYNCQIYNNGGTGINMYSYDGYMSNGYVGAKIFNNLIYNNHTGIHSYGSDPIEPKITNNVITENTMAGIHSTHKYFDTGDYVIANNIFWNNGTGVIHTDTTDLVLYNNGFWANTVDFQGNMEGGLQDEASVFGDPLFIDGALRDFQLSAGSPCIDAGGNGFAASELDYYGKFRIWDGDNDQDTIIDMGVAEYGAPCYVVEETATICGGEQYQLGDSVFTKTGSYSVILSDQYGCDSIVNLDLTVITVNTGITQSRDTLRAEAEGAEYQWLNCTAGYNLVAGATGRTYIPSANGSYSVEVTMGGCRDTSECMDVTVISVPEMDDFGGALKVYPNPTNHLVTIELGTLYSEVRMRVYNMAGQQIWDQNYGTVENLNHVLEGTPGRYLFQIDTGEGKHATFYVVKY